MELLAAEMLAAQIKGIIDACEFKDASVRLWSDSMIMLHWIKKDPSLLKAFVSNRIRKIQTDTKGYVWIYVDSINNPADLVSRGLKKNDFIGNRLWQEGLSWLLKPEIKWPKPKPTITLYDRTEIFKEFKPTLKVEQLPRPIFHYIGEKEEMLYKKLNDWDTIIQVTGFVFCSAVLD